MFNLQFKFSRLFISLKNIKGWHTFYSFIKPVQRRPCQSPADVSGRLKHVPIVKIVQVYLLRRTFHCYQFQMKRSRRNPPIIFFSNVVHYSIQNSAVNFSFSISVSVSPLHTSSTTSVSKWWSWNRPEREVIQYSKPFGNLPLQCRYDSHSR